MKNYSLIIIALLFGYSFSNAQVAFGKAAVDGDGLVDFNSTANLKGILLPNVTTLTNQRGSLVFDVTDDQVKYYQDGTNAGWVSLSDGAATTNDITSTTTALAENGDGVIIGSETTRAVGGVLILESDSKALILPKIASPHLNVIDPEPGMICFDTDKNLLAVYNGTEWSFWK